MPYCKFCGCEKCACNERHLIKKFIISEGELNALEDFAVVDLKYMAEKRADELEVLQERCLKLWRRLIKKADKK